jgi:hypothetical protein
MLLAYSSVSNHDYLIENNDNKNYNINNRIIMIRLIFGIEIISLNFFKLSPSTLRIKWMPTTSITVSRVNL